MKTTKETITTSSLYDGGTYQLNVVRTILGRKKLLWNAKEMNITNFDEANEFVKREYRPGWSLGI
jgi:hypothetical protein